MSKKTNTIKLGFIGVGGVVRWAHLQHLSRWPDVAVTAFCDVNQQAAESVAAEFNGRAYTDPRRMLDAEQLDGVYVCVPPFAHTDAELLVCERKLALFVEKPIALNLDKAQQINAAIAKARNIAAVGYNWRACDITQRARELIGKRTVSAAYGWWVGGFPSVAWWRQQALSGGQFNEQATHIVDIARHLIGGQVTQVYAQGNKGVGAKKHEKHDIHDNIIALLTFSSGTVCSIGTGHISSHGYRVGIDFILDDMTIVHNNNELRVKHPNGEEIIRNTNKPYELEDRAFIEAIKAGDPEGVLCTYADAFETHRVCMAVNESVATGKPVCLK